ncbi:MAG: hypothetical protein NTY38_18570 [Acidobacteria bacterium]|nr:hypothetical protein [Acidobacteriota bacterium]
MNWRRVVVVMGMAGCGLLHGQSYTLTARSTYSQFLVLSPDKPQAEILFPVDDMTSMTVSALASRKSIELTLTDPGGAVRSQDLEYAPEEIPGRSLVYRISKPAIGKWRLSAREPKAFSGVETVILQVRFASNVIAALPGLPGGSTAAGQPVRFTLVVAYESGGLGPSAGIQVNARATGPDGGVVLQFHDDGADGDAQANDGAWVAAYTPLKAGSYIVAATVTGTRKGAAFARTASNSFDFAAPCGKLGAPVDSSAVDTDGDGAGDALELKFPVNADLAGRFEVQARLTGANGVSVAAAGRGDLEAGSQSLTLRLGAADLRTAGDGPYQIARATLSCVTDAGTTKSDERTDLGVTAAFAAATAATRDPLAPTAVNTEKLVDDDGNGRADTLVVGIGLRVAEAGDFSWTAQLVDAAGTVIDTASASGALAAGAATAELRFDGTKIGKNGLVGPFEVRQFEIRGVPGSLFLELAGITKAHNAYQFEGGPQPPGLSVDPTALDFGSVTGGQTKDLNLTIANAATSAASIAALVFSNGRFSAPTVTLPLSVPGGGSRTIAIRFAPDGHAHRGRSHRAPARHRSGGGVQLQFEHGFGGCGGRRRQREHRGHGGGRLCVDGGEQRELDHPHRRRAGKRKRHGQLCGSRQHRGGPDRHHQRGRSEVHREPGGGRGHRRVALAAGGRRGRFDECALHQPDGALSPE